MKQICALFFALLSTTAFAQDLRCEKDYGIFKKQFSQEVMILQNGSAEDLKSFYKQNDYTINKTTKNSSANIFYNGEWYSNQDFNEHMEIILDVSKEEKLKNVSYTLSKPKVNYTSSIGEICVVPTQSEDYIAGVKFLSKYDQIFVRTLNTNEWKSYIYNGIEESSDMNHFFPNLLTKVKLSNLLANDKDFADTSVDMALIMLGSMGVELNDEMVEAVNKEAEPYRLKLKENGYL